MEKILRSPHAVFFLSTQQSENYDFTIDVFQSFLKAVLDLQQSLNLRFIYYLYDSYNVINITRYYDDFNFMRSIYRNSDYDYLALYASTINYTAPEYKRTDRYLVSNYGFARVWQLPLVNKSKDVAYFANVDYTVLTNRNLKPAVYMVGGKVIQTITETDPTSYQSIYFNPFIPKFGYISQETLELITFQRGPNDYTAFPDLSEFEVFPRRPFRYIIFYLDREAELEFILDCSLREKQIIPLQPYKQGINLIDIGETVVPKWYIFDRPDTAFRVSPMAIDNQPFQPRATVLVEDLRLDVISPYSQYIWYLLTDDHGADISPYFYNSKTFIHTGIFICDDIGLDANIGVGAWMGNRVLLDNNWYPNVHSISSTTNLITPHHVIYTDGSNASIDGLGQKTVVPKWYFIPLDYGGTGTLNSVTFDPPNVPANTTKTQYYVHVLPKDPAALGPVADKLKLYYYRNKVQTYNNRTIPNNRELGAFSSLTDCFAQDPYVFYMGQKNCNQRHDINGPSLEWVPENGGGNGVRTVGGSAAANDAAIQLNCNFNADTYPSNLEGGSWFRKKYCLIYFNNFANYNEGTYQVFNLQHVWKFPSFLPSEINRITDPVKKAFVQKYQSKLAIINGNPRTDDLDYYKVYVEAKNAQLLDNVNLYFKSTDGAAQSIAAYKLKKTVNDPPYPVTYADEQYFPSEFNIEFGNFDTELRTNTWAPTINKRAMVPTLDNYKCFVFRFKNWSIFKNWRYPAMEANNFNPPELLDEPNNLASEIRNVWAYMSNDVNGFSDKREVGINNDNFNKINLLTKDLYQKIEVTATVFMFSALKTAANTTVNNVENYSSSCTTSLYLNFQENCEQKLVFGLQNFKRLSAPDGTSLQDLQDNNADAMLFKRIVLTFKLPVLYHKTVCYSTLTWNADAEQFNFNYKTQSNLIQPFDMWQGIAKNQIELFCYNFSDIHTRILPNRYTATAQYGRGFIKAESYYVGTPVGSNYSIRCCGPDIYMDDTAHLPLAPDGSPTFMDWSYFSSINTETRPHRRPFMLPLQLNIDLNELNVNTRNVAFRTPVCVNVLNKHKLQLRTNYPNTFNRAWLKFVRVLMLTTKNPATGLDKDPLGFEYPSKWYKGPIRAGNKAWSFTQPLTWPTLGEVFYFEHTVNEASSVAMDNNYFINGPVQIGNLRETIMVLAVPTKFPGAGLYFDIPDIENELQDNDQFFELLFEGLHQHLSISVFGSQFDKQVDDKFGLQRNESYSLANKDFLKTPVSLAAQIRRPFNVWSQAIMQHRWEESHIMADFNDPENQVHLNNRLNRSFFDRYHIKNNMQNALQVGQQVWPAMIEDVLINPDGNEYREYSFNLPSYPFGTIIDLGIYTGLTPGFPFNTKLALETIKAHFTITSLLTNRPARIGEFGTWAEILPDLSDVPFVCRDATDGKAKCDISIDMYFDIFYQGPSTNIWNPVFANQLCNLFNPNVNVPALQLQFTGIDFPDIPDPEPGETFASGFTVKSETSPNPIINFACGQENLVGNLNTGQLLPFPNNSAQEFNAAHFIVHPIKNKCTNFKNEKKYFIPEKGLGPNEQWTGEINTNDDGVKLSMRYALAKFTDNEVDVSSFFGYVKDNLQEMVIYQRDEFDIKKHYDLNSPIDMCVFVNEPVWEQTTPIKSSITTAWKTKLNLPANTTRMFKYWGIDLVYKSTLMETCMVLTDAEFRFNQFLPIYNNSPSDETVLLQTTASNSNASFYIISPINPNTFVKGFVVYLTNENF